MSEQVENKEQAEVKGYVPFEVVTFSALDAHREAVEKSENLQELVYDFRKLIDNVIVAPEIEITDKAAAISALADEFKARISDALAKEQYVERYAEIEQSFDKALDSDFAGGCTVCGFGHEKGIKAYGKCPFCGVEHADSSGG